MQMGILGHWKVRMVQTLAVDLRGLVRLSVQPGLQNSPLMIDSIRVDWPRELGLLGSIAMPFLISEDSALRLVNSRDSDL